jgi:hypothetical protein
MATQEPARLSKERHLALGGDRLTEAEGVAKLAVNAGLTQHCLPTYPGQNIRPHGLDLGGLFS